MREKIINTFEYIGEEGDKLVVKGKMHRFGLKMQRAKKLNKKARILRQSARREEIFTAAYGRIETMQQNSVWLRIIKEIQRYSKASHLPK